MFYTSISRNGVRYRQDLGGTRPSTSPQAPDGLAHAVEEGTVQDLVDSSSAEVLAEINRPHGSWLARMFGRSQPTPLNYELDAEAAQTFAEIQAALNALAQTSTLWLVETTQTTSNQKYHAGATSLLTRRPIRAGKMSPRGISSNIDVLGLDTGRQQFFFFPDRIFVRQDGKYGAVAYSDLHVEHSESQFREEGNVPSDAKIISQTWKYVNKNGGPDHRFNNNGQIPVALYGQVQFQSSTGLHLLVQVSNKIAADQCYALLSTALSKLPPDVNRVENAGEALNHAYETLQQVKQAIVEVTTARQRLATQSVQTKLDLDHLDAQVHQSLASAPVGSVRTLVQRRAAARQQLADLDTQIQALDSQKQKLAESESKLSASVEGLRPKTDSGKAT